jgi:hypothetical protein
LTGIADEVGFTVRQALPSSDRQPVCYITVLRLAKLCKYAHIGLTTR